MTTPRLRSSTNGSFSKQVQMSVLALATFLMGCAMGSYHSQTNTETRSLELLNYAVPPAANCEKRPQKVENNQG
jgi:hypothetical protein